MLSDLKTWELNRPTNAPQLLVISTGTVESNRAMQLQARVVLDPTFSVGRLYGVSGTPSAVLVNAQGMVASSVAVGAPGILTLMSAAQPATSSEKVEQPV